MMDNLDDIVVIFGLFINLIGTFILSKGLLSKDSEIEDMLRIPFGGPPNKKLVKHYKANRKSTKIGLIILGLGFITQIIGILWYQLYNIIIFYVR